MKKLEGQVVITSPANDYFLGVSIPIRDGYATKTVMLYIDTGDTDISIEVFPQELIDALRALQQIAASPTL